MEKREITIGLNPLVEIKFQDKYVNIDKYISQEIQYDLAKNYVSILFGENEMVSNYYSAEWYLVLNIVDKCTSLVALEEKGKQNIELDTIISSGLWKAITDQIENYNEFRIFLKDICFAMREEKALEKSISQSFDKVANKVIELIDKVENIDMSKEGLSELVSGLNTQIDKFKTDFPTSESIIPKQKRQYKKKEK